MGGQPVQPDRVLADKGYSSAVTQLVALARRQQSLPGPWSIRPPTAVVAATPTVGVPALGPLVYRDDNAAECGLGWTDVSLSGAGPVGLPGPHRR